MYVVQIMITSSQVKMARAALGIGVRELAERAGITANTVSRFENSGGGLATTVNAIQKALEDAGIIFIAKDEHGGAGVRLKD
jgi:transcriptional regulator with XRE-family HTH domain